MGRNLDPSSGCPHSDAHQTEGAGHSETNSSRDSLFIFDGVITGITNSDLELEAHDRVTGPLAAALPADGLPTLSAVMLPGWRETGVSCASWESRGNRAKENPLAIPPTFTVSSTDTRYAQFYQMATVSKNKNNQNNPSLLAGQQLGLLFHSAWSAISSNIQSKLKFF